MKIKTLFTTLLITTSLSVNAGWEKIDMGMYDVMKLDGAEIIGETGYSRLLTTIRIGASKMVGFDYYRCNHNAYDMDLFDYCWKLSPDK